MRPPAFVETATESTVQTMDLTVDASDKVGGTTTARCFCTSAMLEGTSPGGRLTVPLLTVKRTDHAAAQQQARDMQRLDQLLERLDDGIADGYAKNKVTFSIHREAANDDFEWGQTMASCTPAETAEAQRIIAEAKAEIQADLDAATAKADAEIAAKTAESEKRISEIRAGAMQSVEEVARDTAAEIVAAMGGKADAKTVAAAVAERMKG